MTKMGIGVNQAMVLQWNLLSAHQHLKVTAVLKGVIHRLYLLWQLVHSKYSLNMFPSTVTCAKIFNIFLFKCLTSAVLGHFSTPEKPFCSWKNGILKAPASSLKMRHATSLKNPLLLEGHFLTLK